MHKKLQEVLTDELTKDLRGKTRLCVQYEQVETIRDSQRQGGNKNWEKKNK